MKDNLKNESFNQNKNSGGKNLLLLRDCVSRSLEEYLCNLDGHDPFNLYDLVMKEIELPLLESALKYAKDNKTIAAKILGLNRGTLRKKLKLHKLDV